MLFCHVVITVCACTFVTCTLIKINQSINVLDAVVLSKEQNSFIYLSSFTMPKAAHMTQY